MARYRIVPERSQVWIEASSTLHPIHTRTDGLEGFLELELRDGGRIDPDAPAAGHLSLPVSRLRSGNRLEDRELQRLIDARRFPTIDGTLTSITADGADGSYRVQGQLSFRGVDRDCEDDMTVAVVDAQELLLTGESVFDIRDFGMEPPKVLMFKVRPEVRVRVELAAEKED